jgi:site-specific recombinase XerD
VVDSFFTEVGRNPGEVTALYVQEWYDRMRHGGRSPATIYAHVSFLSSFYTWARRELGVGANPTLLARPKVPKPYQTGSTKSLTDEEMNCLLASVKSRADAGSVVAKRDYTLLLLFFLTGLRRRELVSLRGTDLEFKEKGLVLKYRRKGGKYRAREVMDVEFVEALAEYVTASGREEVFGSDRPLWTRHDRAGRASVPLSSRSFVKNLKGLLSESRIPLYYILPTTAANFSMSSTASSIIPATSLPSYQSERSYRWYRSPSARRAESQLKEPSMSLRRSTQIVLL